MKYLYASHLGGFFTTDKELEDTYCEECGDSDTPLGTIETVDDMIDAAMKYNNEDIPSAYTLNQALIEFPESAQEIMKDTEAAYFAYQTAVNDLKDFMEELKEKYHVKEETESE